MIRRPPRSTLFPSPPLFRSTAVIEGKTETGRRLAGAYCIRGNDLTAKGELDSALADLNESIKLDPTYACAYNNRGDRKSTRLNSSHSQISYAVFCLKKKKKK